MDNSFLYTKTLLLVDDELDLLKMLSDILKDAGFQKILMADTGKEAVAEAKKGKPDLIILDVMLPDKDGFSLMEQLRSFTDVPIIFLTAKDEAADKLAGLGLGADDYITKPFSTEELLARIRSISRRNQHMVVENALTFSDITLNLSTYEMFCGEKSIKLGLKEFYMMELLLRNGSIVLSKETLIEKIWGYESDAEYNNVEVYISFLRKKLTHIESTVSIKTVRGVGYCLESKQH